MWDKGFLRIGKEVIEYSVKHYEEPSEYGINEGKISKLCIKHHGEWIVNYDRGWDIKPQTEIAKAAYKILLERYN